MIEMQIICIHEKRSRAGRRRIVPGAAETGKIMAFTHLHVHTEDSLLDGSNKIKEYVKRVKELGMDSAAITDHGVMYGVIDFYKECKAQGIRPILGCEIYVAPGSRFDKELTGGEDRYYHLVLLAENNTGYDNLVKIVSRGFTEGYYYKPRVDMELLQECVENLQQITEESFGFSCTALLGTACSGIGGIHESYMQAQAMEEYINLLDTLVLRYDKVQDLRFVYEYPEELELKIIHAMKIGDEKTAGQCMMEVFDRNLSGQVKANTYRCLIFDMIGTLLKGANTGGYHHADREIELLEHISVKTPVEEARDKFLKCLALICSQIRQIRMQASSDHIFSQKVEMYVKENFTDPDLNISIASQHFRMTPSYLSSLYKKQTGKSLLEFINTVRIDFAERLLKEGCSVADAAEQSGFRDSAGFIRAFKKKKGITPGQLKKEF